MGQVVRFKQGHRKPKRRPPGGRQSRSFPWLPLLLAIACGAGALYLSWQRRETTSASGFFTLCRSGGDTDCVVDGDTFRYGANIIRVEDIDTPETHRAQCASELALGNRATFRFQALLNNGPFEIVHDGGRDTDSYGRQLRLVERDGQSLGAVLVAEGLARPWTGQRRSWCD